MNVEKFQDKVQRLEFQGNTVSPGKSVTQDVAGFAFDKEGYVRQEVPGVSKRMILTQSTELMKTNTIHPVMLDLNVDKNAVGVAANPKVLPAPNKYTAPRSGGDIQITKYEDKVVEDPDSVASNRKQ
jgi:hypothetical protein